MSNSNWGWRSMIPIDIWHALAQCGFPGWDKDNDGSPYCVNISYVAGSSRSSEREASHIDKWCKGQFYYRDFTANSLPIVKDGELYRSVFWFQNEHEARYFAGMNWTEAVTIKGVANV